MAERIQKIMAHWGIASRRSAEKMINEGRVTCNGAVVSLGDRADLTQDQLCVDGKPITPEARPANQYYLINKPKGIVSTCDDPQGRPTVLRLLPHDLQRGQGMHPIGRLDTQSTGALLLTNDGELTLSLTHPRYHVPKLYRVWLQGQVPESVLDQWRQGVMLGDRRTLPAEITLKKINQDKTCVDIMLTEGRNRQIRRVAEQLGHPVLSLHRLAIGPIKLGHLAPGKARPLRDHELTQLHQTIQTIASVTSPAPIREYPV